MSQRRRQQQERTKLARAVRDAASGSGTFVEEKTPGTAVPFSPDMGLQQAMRALEEAVPPPLRGDHLAPVLQAAGALLSRIAKGDEDEDGVRRPPPVAVFNTYRQYLESLGLTPKARVALAESMARINFAASEGGNRFSDL